MVDPKTEAGKMIRYARTQCWFSQKELAERCGMDQSQLSTYERGDVDPRTSYLRRILDACGFELVMRRKKND